MIERRTAVKIRTAAALLLMILLLAPGTPALAAPTREMQAVEVELNQGLRALVHIAVNAVPEEQITLWEKAGNEPLAVLAEGDTPSPEMAEAALANALLYTRQTNVLSPGEAADMYGQIFTAGEYALPDSPLTPYCAVTPEGLEANSAPAAGENALGVYVYSAVFDGSDVLVDCDVFRCPEAGMVPDPEELPEDGFSWAFNARLSLRFSPGTEFGYTLSSLSFSPPYQAGALAAWQEADNTEYEYSVSLPSHLHPSESTPARMTWETADGSAALSILAEEGARSLDESLAAFLRAHPGQRVVQERLFDYFCAFGEGSFTMIVSSEELPWHYTVTLTFPPERQAEYSLYAEFIRNSFSVWGISNG